MTETQTKAGDALIDYVQQMGNGSIAYKGRSDIAVRVRKVEAEAREAGRREGLTVERLAAELELRALLIHKVATDPTDPPIEGWQTVARALLAALDMAEPAQEEKDSE